MLLFIIYKITEISAKKNEKKLKYIVLWLWNLFFFKKVP